MKVNNNSNGIGFVGALTIGIITIVDIYACGDSRDCCSFLGCLADRRLKEDKLSNANKLHEIV
ncbi:MAG: hypothetical protein D8G53_03485 [Candidatus Saccharimonas sp.]|nr:MAG: hypothetical protein D8G53_03485 [Candidatus Saccharimonas sp.]